MSSKCHFPFFAKSRKDENIKFNLVPCGKCEQCAKRRASEWSFRLMQEDKRSRSSSFITLTYATTHAPITRNGYLSIKKRDLQLFFKRLRKAHSGSKRSDIKYYAVGEYGGKLKRPHYHVILFNAKIAEISKAWNKGHVHYGSVSGASVGYTLKYISKPYKNFRMNDDREKPFSLMSKHLGANYLSAKMIRWHKVDLENRMYVNLEGGKKCTMPRYYKLRLYNDQEKEKIAAACRVRLAERILNDLFKYSKEDELETRWEKKRLFELQTLKA